MANARVERPATMTMPRKDAAHDESRPLQRDVRLHAVDYAVCYREIVPEAAIPGTASACGTWIARRSSSTPTLPELARLRDDGPRDRSHGLEPRDGARLEN